MPVNIKNLDTAADALTSGTVTSTDLMKISGYTAFISNYKVSNTVSTSTALPTASENIGRLMYITASDSWAYSNGTSWAMDESTVLGATAYAWGYNAGAQLGDGSTTDRNSPVTTAGGGSTWASIGTGKNNSAGIKSDGTLWTWGTNTQGSLGNGTTTARSSPGTTVGGGTDWSKVSPGYNNMAAIKTDGTLWTWGFNYRGSLGTGDTAARSSPGTVAGGGSTWAEVSSSIGMGLMGAVKTDGTLWTWGSNGYGGLGSSETTTTSRSSPGTTAGGGSTWSKISVGGENMGAIKTDGTLWTWGHNYRGALGDGTTTNRSSPVTTSGGGTTWSQISASPFFMAAVKTDGTLWTWGANFYGNLGTGNLTSRSSPGTVAGGGTTWSIVAAGEQHTAAIKTDGTLWTWGDNGFVQLGTGNSTLRSSPGTTVAGGTDWIAVDSGKLSSVGLRIVKGFNTV